MQLGNKGYSPVNERVKAFRKVYPCGTIETKIDDLQDNSVRMSTIIRDQNGNIIATGNASEMKSQNSRVNQTSMIENCETSSVGRALGFAGFGIDNAIASGEDIERNKEQMKQYEIYNNLFIREADAVATIKNSINELIRKMGIRKVELEHKVEELLWTDLSSLNLKQYQKLELKLKS